MGLSRKLDNNIDRIYDLRDAVRQIAKKAKQEGYDETRDKIIDFIISVKTYESVEPQLDRCLNVLEMSFNIEEGKDYAKCDHCEDYFFFENLHQIDTTCWVCEDCRDEYDKLPTKAEEDRHLNYEYERAGL